MASGEEIEYLWGNSSKNKSKLSFADHDLISLEICLLETVPRNYVTGKGFKNLKIFLDSVWIFRWEMCMLASFTLLNADMIYVSTKYCFCICSFV